MATARKSTGVFISGPSSEAEEAEFIDQVPLSDDSQETAFEELRSQSGAESDQKVMWVYRVPTDAKGAPITRGQMEQLISTPIDAMSIDQVLETVRNEFMADDDRVWLIRVHVRKPGQRGILWQQVYTVRKALKAKATAQESKLGEVISAVREMQAMHMQREQPRAVPAQDNFGIREILAMQQQSMQNTIAMMAAMNGGGAKSASADPMDAMSKMIAMMGQMNSLRESLGGGGGDDNSTLGLVKALAPMGVGLMEVLKKNQPAQLAAPVATLPHQGPPAVAAPIPNATGPAAIQPLNTDAPMIAELRKNLEALADIAATNPDAKETAAMVLSQLPEEYDNQIYQLLSGGNWFAQICILQPKMKPHEAWLTTVRDEILASFAEGDTPAP